MLMLFCVFFDVEEELEEDLLCMLEIIMIIVIGIDDGFVIFWDIVDLVELV